MIGGLGLSSLELRLCAFVVPAIKHTARRFVRENILGGSMKQECIHHVASRRLFKGAMNSVLYRLIEANAASLHLAV
ncbi:unnamed protein product [Periconia digitata]|uniref:Uncharacterized protein n=1 Tax=Periconia digitata TaxID=1303443 RepID=A0A9W4U9D9_9PLEO|nr:unnamed protein product [Periconia digitata]